MEAKRRTGVSCPLRRPNRLASVPRKLDAFSCDDNVLVDDGVGCKPAVLDGKTPVSAASRGNGGMPRAPRRSNMKDDMDVDHESEGCGDGEGGDMRRSVKDLLHSYREVLGEMKKENELKSNVSKNRDIHREVAMQLGRQGRWLNSLKRLGAVPGVEVGDEFGCRAEMRIIGLHCQFQDGIDYMDDCGPLATSIVESGRYANAYVNLNFLMYSGCGGNPLTSLRGKLCDQKLERGNLALKNSKSRKTPVRVIYKDRLGNQQYIYKYRGLYLVEDLKQGRSSDGKLTFKFLLRRIEGHPNVDWVINSKLVNWVLSSDEGALKISSDACRAKNARQTMATAGREKSRPLSHLTKAAQPNMSNRGASMGCDQIHGCPNPEGCSCEAENGGRHQYGCGARIFYKASLIHGFGFHTPLLPFLNK